MIQNIKHNNVYMISVFGSSHLPNAHPSCRPVPSSYATPPSPFYKRFFISCWKVIIINFIIFLLFCIKEISDSIEFIAADTGRSKTTFTQERKEIYIYIYNGFLKLMLLLKEFLSTLTDKVDSLVCMACTKAKILQCF